MFLSKTRSLFCVARNTGKKMHLSFQKHVEADGTITLTPPNPTHSLLWLHGLGGSASTFLDYFTYFNLSQLFLGARIVLLQARLRPVGVYGGFTVPSWYDIKLASRAGFASLPDDQLFSIPQMKESVAIIQAKVDRQAEYWKTNMQSSKAVDPYRERIFVGGISQGCCTSLYYGLQCQRPIAGIIGFSGHLMRSVNPKNLDKTPVLLFHGSNDTILIEEDCKKSYGRILGHKNVKYRSIAGLGHTVNAEQLFETAKWLETRTSNLQQ